MHTQPTPNLQTRDQLLRAIRATDRPLVIPLTDMFRAERQVSK